jgi:hypothetical protein
LADVNSATGFKIYPKTDVLVGCVVRQKSARVVVRVCAANAAAPVRGHAPGPVTRTTPLLDIAQLIAIVTNPAWSTD